MGTPPGTTHPPLSCPTRLPPFRLDMQADRTRTYWICQLAGWSTYALVNATLNALGSAPGAYVLALIVVVPAVGIGLTHGYRRLIRRWGWTRLSILKLLGRVLTASVLLSIVMTGVMIGLAVLFGPSDLQEENLTLTKIVAGLSVALVNLSVVFFVWSFCYFGTHLLWNYNEAQVARWKLEANLKATKLKALEFQMNPHFLFNSLNSIRALITENPPQAKHMVTQLSALLRQALHAGEAMQHPLRAELRTVRAYLELEAVRLDDHLTYHLDADAALLDRPVPLLMIQTLVENAIKHGIARQAAGGTLTVRVIEADGQMVLTVTNDGTLQDTERPGGIGLANVRERLHLLHGDAATLTLAEAPPGTVTARVVLPLATRPAAPVEPAELTLSS